MWTGLLRVLRISSVVKPETKQERRHLASIRHTVGVDCTTEQKDGVLVMRFIAS